ncbi:hypothetical protein DID78_03780 [Candidatus Marinamargulisbacteria bacterium SCGC AG-343-D04]|nr:hypothetical protein DID78_03780 [Candidatus Marinamargulisbacteria bacterium SCGC AG-343-D04]
MALRRKKVANVDTGDSESGDVQTVYGDLVTFIMMLFVLLFVLSYNEKKTHNFITDFQVKFGEIQEEKQQTLTTDALLVSKIEHYIDRQKIDEFANVVVDEHRVKLILSPPILFNSGKADIRKEGYKVLYGAAEVFKTVINPLVIEGHTDNVPISNDEFASNWELSFFRAFSVIKYYISKLKFSPDRVSALGYGEYRPLVENDTVQHRAMNRRIELNVIRLTKTDELDEDVDDSF